MGLNIILAQRFQITTIQKYYYLNNIKDRCSNYINYYNNYDSAITKFYNNNITVVRSKYSTSYVSKDILSIITHVILILINIE